MTLNFQLEAWQVYISVVILGIFQGIGYAIADVYVKPMLKKYHVKKAIKLKDKIIRRDETN